MALKGHRHAQGSYTEKITNIYIPAVLAWNIDNSPVSNESSLCRKLYKYSSRQKHCPAAGILQQAQRFRLQTEVPTCTN